MIRLVVLQFCLTILTTLSVVGTSHSAESVMIPGVKSKVIIIQAGQSFPDSQILEWPWPFQSQAKIQDNLTEYPPERTSPGYPVLKNKFVVDHDSLRGHCSQVNVDKIYLSDLRQLIFPFHSFW